MVRYIIVDLPFSVSLYLSPTVLYLNITVLYLKPTVLGRDLPLTQRARERCASYPRSSSTTQFALPLRCSSAVVSDPPFNTLFASRLCTGLSDGGRLRLWTNAAPQWSCNDVSDCPGDERSNPVAGTATGVIPDGEITARPINRPLLWPVF